MRDLIEPLTKELEKEDFFLSIKKVSEILIERLLTFF